MSGSLPWSWVPLLLPITPVSYLPGPAAPFQHLESSWSPLWGLSSLTGEGPGFRREGPGLTGEGPGLTDEGPEFTGEGPRLTDEGLGFPG